MNTFDHMNLLLNRARLVNAPADYHDESMLSAKAIEAFIDKHTEKKEEINTSKDLEV